MSKIDLDHVYGQAMLSKEAAKQCVFSIIGVILPDTTGVQRAFADWQITPPYSKNTSTKYWYHMCNKRYH